MMFLEWLVSLITYPIKWFWKKYEMYKETRNISKLVLLFIFSISGILILGITILKLIHYLFSYHLNFLICIGLIFWLYTYIRDNVQKSAVDTTPSIPADIIVQAEKGYPIMRNIIYQTAKAIAPDIGGKIPRLLNEIEMPEEHYILTNNICFYQFRLKKADMRTLYTSTDLKEFKSIIQSTLSEKIRLGEFPTKFENYRDKYGNWQDAVIVDTIEDIGNCFVIQSVFCTPEYSEYEHPVRMNQDASNGNSTPLETQWKDGQ